MIPCEVSPDCVPASPTPSYAITTASFRLPAGRLVQARMLSTPNSPLKRLTPPCTAHNSLGCQGIGTSNNMLIVCLQLQHSKSQGNELSKNTRPSSVLCMCSTSQLPVELQILIMSKPV
jgi:hypothetical protein